MRLHYFPFSEQPLSVWRGGTTRQLAIFPFDTKLAEKNFIFRISTATVETETSAFSKFENYDRILMILEGQLDINHKGHHKKHLNKFETDRFNGGWETSAEGKVVDFNVIYSDKIEQAEVRKHSLSGGEEQIIEMESFTGVHILFGSIEVNDLQLKDKDFILAESTSAHEKIKLVAKVNCEYIVVTLMKY